MLSFSPRRISDRPCCSFGERRVYFSYLNKVYRSTCRIKEGGSEVEVNVKHFSLNLGEQEWHSSENAGLFQYVLVQFLDVASYVRLSLLLVLYSAPRGFYPGSLALSSSQKPTFPNSNSILECMVFLNKFL